MLDNHEQENINTTYQRKDKTSERLYKYGNVGFVKNISTNLEVVGWFILIIGLFFGIGNIIISMLDNVGYLNGIAIIIKTLVVFMLILGFSRVIYLLELLVEQGREK